MPRRPALGLSLFLGLALAATTAVAQEDADGRMSAGVRVGTSGVGAEVAFRLGGRAAVRVLAEGLSYDETVTETEVTYAGELVLAHGGLLLDLHPGGGPFHVSLGAFVGDDRLEVEAPLAELLLAEEPGLPIGGLDLGRATGTASGETLAPYAGIGWGGPHGGGRRWRVSLDLGAAYLGAPDVELTADTTLPIHLVPGGQALLDQVVADEERELEAELADYRWLPVVSLGVGYTF